MTTPDTDDILTQMLARRRAPLNDEQVRKVAQSLINLNAFIPGAITEQQEARLKQRFPDIVPTSMPPLAMFKPNKKRRASKRA